MFSMTKSRGLCEVQTPFSFVATRHSGEDMNIVNNTELAM